MDEMSIQEGIDYIRGKFKGAGGYARHYNQHV